MDAVLKAQQDETLLTLWNGWDQFDQSRYLKQGIFTETDLEVLWPHMNGYQQAAVMEYKLLNVDQLRKLLGLPAQFQREG